MQKFDPPTPRAPSTPGVIEWPTLALAAVIHGGWLAATYWHQAIPLVALAAAGGWVTAWHGSLQHEVIHGHPTRWPAFNAALASAPLSLWLPLAAYRQSHLAHHATEHLTDPAHDPESRYLASGHGARRIVVALQGSLLGRLILGPPFQIAGFLAGQVCAVVRGDAGARRMWARHVLAMAPVLLWLGFVCRMPLTEYLLAFVYPGASLSLLRSFAEHRAAPRQAARVAVVERAPILGLLYPNNNLHAAHHAWPGAPWYRLGRLYAAHRHRLLAGNDGLLYDGYLDVARRFLFRAHDRIDYISHSLAEEGAAS